jgi:hypothetical protein
MAPRPPALPEWTLIAVPWPVGDNAGAVHVVEEVDDLRPFAEDLRFAGCREVVIERELDHAPGQQHPGCLAGADQVNPTLRGAPILEVVVEPDPQRALVRDRSPECVSERGHQRTVSSAPIHI